MVVTFCGLQLIGRSVGLLRRGVVAGRVCLPADGDCRTASLPQPFFVGRERTVIIVIISGSLLGIYVYVCGRIFQNHVFFPVLLGGIISETRACLWWLLLQLLVCYLPRVYASI